jgi:tRNA-dihydrouridine synthase B
MLEHYGTQTGIKIARKHIGWYSKGLPGSAEFRSEVNRSMEPAEVFAMVRRFYEPMLDRQAA